MALRLFSLFLFVVVVSAKEEETPFGGAAPQALWKTGIKAGLKTFASALLQTKKDPLPDASVAKVDKALDTSLNSRELNEYLDDTMNKFNVLDMQKLPKAISLIGKLVQGKGNADGALEQQMRDMGVKQNPTLDKYD